MRRRNVLMAVTCLGLLAALALGLLCGGSGNDGAVQDQGGGGKEALLRLGPGFNDLGFKRFVIRHKATVIELDRRRGIVRLALPGKLSGGDIAEAARSGAFLDRDGLKNQSGAEALATSDPHGQGFESGAGTRGPRPKALGSLWTVSRGHSDAPSLTTASTRSWAAAKPKAGKSPPSQAGGLTVSVSRLGGDGIAPAASLGEETAPPPVAVAEADTSTFGSDHLVRFQGSGSYAPAGHILGPEDNGVHIFGS